VDACSRLNDSENPKTARQAYMGHIILIAEELVKFLARCPPELLEVVQDSFVPSEWDAFVAGALTDAKSRDMRPLAGGKPMIVPATTADDNKSDSSSDEEDGEAAKIGEPLTRTLAGGGIPRGYTFDQDDDDDVGDVSKGLSLADWQGWRARSMDSSDDDDDDAEWPPPSGRGAGSDDGFGVS
jgi:SIT4-associating protein SAP185/190